MSDCVGRIKALNGDQRLSVMMSDTSPVIEDQLYVFVYVCYCGRNHLSERLKD